MKIFGACTLITAFAAGSTGAMSYYILQQGRRDRGNFLDKHIKRYLDYEKGVGRSIEAVAQIAATDPRVRNLLDPDRTPRPSPPRPTVAPAGGRAAVGGSDETKKTTSRQKDRRHIKATLRSVLRGVRAAFDPQLMLVIDASRRTLFRYPQKGLKIQPERQRVCADVLNQIPVAGEILVLGGHAYLVSGAPIMSKKTKGKVLGAVLIGVNIERYFDNYRIQSDNRIPKQHRLILVNKEYKILASVFPKGQWSTLAPQLQKEKRKQVYEGNRKVDVIKWASNLYDFTTLRITGYHGHRKGIVGRLFLLRIRKKHDIIKDLMGYLLPGVGGIALVALVVASVLSFLITRPIRTFIRATDEIVAGGGDLTRRIKIRSKDELGDLAQNLNQLFERLGAITSHVQKASFQVGASSTELSAASKQMLDGAKEQAIKIESSTAAVTELSSSIQQVADNAMQTTKVAQSSGDEVSDAIDRMNQIRSTVEDVGHRITELGESGKRIGKIVEVIRQISEQTSLLALNASIEAAHAGEHGRGFAVVADEVSSLARRVGQSAKDIEDLIATITEQTAEAVRTMGNAIEEVEGGTSLVKNTLGSIRQIVEVISDTATAVQEQALASDEIARNMDVVQRIAQEVLNSSEEAVLQGERLQTLGVKLEESVKGFKVKNKPRAGRQTAQTQKALIPPSQHTSQADLTQADHEDETAESNNET